MPKAAAPTDANAAPATPVDLDAELTAALDQGIAAATDGAPVDAAPANANDAGVDSGSGGDHVDGADAADGDDNDEADAGDLDSSAPAGDAADPDAAGADAAAAAGAQAGAAAKPDAVEAEVKELNLKDKAAERFRELSRDRAEMAPVREAMQTLGLTEPARVVAALERVRDADFVIERVLATGADHTQFDQTLSFLELANSPEPENMRRAYDMAIGQATELAKMLGIDVPGLVDPLDEFPDLKAEVEAGDTPRERALQIAAANKRDAIAQAQRQQAGQRQSQQQQEQQQREQAINAGKASLTELGHRLQQADPARYAALKPQLVTLIGQLSADPSVKPGDWAREVALAYATMQAPAPAPAPVDTGRPSVGYVSGRPGGAPPLAPAEFDSAEDAFEFGLRQASGG